MLPEGEPTGFKIGGKISEYERLRLEKIRRNKALLDSLFPDLAESKAKLKSSLSLKRKEKRRTLSAPYSNPDKVSGPVVVRRNPGRKARNSLTPSHAPPGATICQKSDEHSALEEKYFQFESKIRIYRSYTSEPVEIELQSDEETEEEREERIRLMQKPARHVMEKKYDRTHGTTCHQCRQKTLDGKTRCNNKNCVGVRGQFCGVCLLNRYGEDAETAIADKTWVCPPCKGYCNCSMCRSRKGKAPTGILTPVALNRGFNSVKDYLASLNKDTENSEDEEDTNKETSENQPDQVADSQTSDPDKVPDSQRGDPTSEMDCDDENKENIDPMLSVGKENIAAQIGKQRIVPLAPRIVLRDARLSRSRDHDMSRDADVDKIRRSTEQLNISNNEEVVDANMMSPSPTRLSTTKTPASKKKKPVREISRCLITWQSSKYAGGHQWVTRDRIPVLEREKVPPLGKQVQVRWGKNKSNKLYPATLIKVEYSLKRRRSCKF